MSDLSEPQCGELPGRSQTQTASFQTLAEAFGFLDKEREEIERMLQLYHSHVKELVQQVLQQSANPQPKRKKKA